MCRQGENGSQGKDAILVINMFSGSHHDNDVVANTDHEIINLFKTDLSKKDTEESSGSYFIYVPCDGSLDEDRWSKTKVLMVRYLGNQKYEILARALVEKNLSKGAQGDLLKSICYGGESLEKIMQESGQGFKKSTKGEGKNNEKVTFKASLCQEPKIPIYINCKENESHRREYVPHLTHQTQDVSSKMSREPIEIDVCMISDTEKKGALLVPRQRRFIAPGEESDRSKDKNIQPYAFDILNSLFDKRDLNWDEKGVPSVQEYKADFKEKKNLVGRNNGFLSLINKDDSELAYSDLLVHFLDNSELLCKSLIRCLLRKAGVKCDNEAELLPLNIARERKRIDLLITTKNRIFIVENKINARLDEDEDGLSEAVRMQLSSNEKVAGGQLQRYVTAVKKELNEAEERATKKGFEPDDPKDILAFIICPTRHDLYNEYTESLATKGAGMRRMINTGTDEKPILKLVPVISYNEILKCWDCGSEDLSTQTFRKLDNVWRNDEEISYFKEFVAMLRWQENPKHDDRSEKFLRLSRKRFLRAIDIAKASSK